MYYGPLGLKGLFFGRKTKLLREQAQPQKIRIRWFWILWAFFSGPMGPKSIDFGSGMVGQGPIKDPNGPQGTSMGPYIGYNGYIIFISFRVLDDP